jgi:hypothetical protein
VEYFIFQKKRSKRLKSILFYHISSFIIITVALYVRENEQIFFGLFFAGFLVILLSYFILESVKVTTTIMKLFTGSIAFWVVISYFPLSPFLSVVFGAVAFFLCYIFFDIPGKVIEPSPALMQQTKEPEQVVFEEGDNREKSDNGEKLDRPPEQKVDVTLSQQQIEGIITELDQVITQMKTAPFYEYTYFKDVVDDIKVLYSEKADLYQQYISRPELERVHTLIAQCETVLSTMKDAEKDWTTLKTELAYMKTHAATLLSDEIARVHDLISTFWSNYEQIIPPSYSVMVQKELTTIESSILHHEKMKKEWADLKRAVNAFINVPFADRKECELIKERFDSIVASVDIPREDIDEVRQKIRYGESRIAIMEEWNTLLKALDAAKGNPERMTALKKEFLFNIGKFESVIPAEDISWLETQFKR